ncbi:MAG TPA: leucine-rich repeat domain-containing protein [Pseudobacteroides sp.]|uniref:leucine-rich repeat domain-containing protein n=1 Tax=Pseudobacteroides sp. TaxID=1968840 RepID=UPI002F95E936
MYAATPSAIISVDFNNDGSVNMGDVVFIGKYFGRIVEKPTPTQMPTPTSNDTSLIDTGDFVINTATGTIVKYKGSGGNVTVPKGVNRVNQSKVTSIGSNAFYYCKLTSISIPDGVAVINDGTFSGCKSLATITIPNRVSRIGMPAFNDCTKLSNAYFVGHQPDFGSYAFSNTKLGFKIVILPTSQGFGKPDPYKNESSGVWFLNCSESYDVVIADSIYTFDATTGTILMYNG